MLSLKKDSKNKKIALNFKNPFECGGALFRPEVVADRVTKARLVPEWMEENTAEKSSASETNLKGLYIEGLDDYKKEDALNDLKSILPSEIYKNKADRNQETNRIVFEITEKEAFASGDNGVVLLYKLVNSEIFFLYEIGILYLKRIIIKLFI